MRSGLTQEVEERLACSRLEVPRWIPRRGYRKRSSKLSTGEKCRVAVVRGGGEPPREAAKGKKDKGCWRV